MSMKMLHRSRSYCSQWKKLSTTHVILSVANDERLVPKSTPKHLRSRNLQNGTDGSRTLCCGLTICWKKWMIKLVPRCSHTPEQKRGGRGRNVSIGLSLNSLLMF